MICTLATRGRAIARSACAQVSTETPYAPMRPVVDELVERVEDGVVLVDLVGRAVQLHEVDPLDAEVRARARVPGAKRLAVVVLRQLLDAPAHLRRDEDLRVTRAQLAAELLAAAVAVDVGGVEERDPGLDGRVEHGVRRLRRDRAPVGAELPGAEADDADAAAESLDAALLHRGASSQVAAPMAARRGWRSGRAQASSARSSRDCSTMTSAPRSSSRSPMPQVTPITRRPHGARRVDVVEAVADHDGVARAERLAARGRRSADFGSASSGALTTVELEPEALEQRRDELALLGGRERERQRQAAQHLGDPVDEPRLLQVDPREDARGRWRRTAATVSRALGRAGQLGERAQRRRADEARDLGGAGAARTRARAARR